MNLFPAVIIAAVLLAPTAARADRIANPIAIFAGLDKITGTITTFEVPIDGNKQFGSLVVRPRTCFSRPPEEEPKTTSFVEVEEVAKRHVEHPVYDVWLTGCFDPNAPKPPVEEQVDPETLNQQAVPQDNE